MNVDTESFLLAHLSPLLAWLNDGGDSWAMDIRYWDLRRVDLDNRSLIDPRAGEILSHLDVTMDVFHPDEVDQPPPMSIGEAAMRSEALGYLADLRALGYLRSWAPPSDIPAR